MALYVNKATGRDSRGKITYSAGERVNRDTASTRARISELNARRVLKGQSELKGTEGRSSGIAAFDKQLQEAKTARADFEAEDRRLIREGYTRGSEIKDESGEVVGYNYNPPAQAAPVTTTTTTPSFASGNVDPRTGKLFGTVTAAPPPPTATQQFISGVKGVFLSPRETFQRVRYPITASDISTPAVRAAAREDTIFTAGALTGGAAAVVLSTPRVAGAIIETAGVVRSVAPTTTALAQAYGVATGVGLGVSKGAEYTRQQNAFVNDATLSAVRERSVESSSRLSFANPVGEGRFNIDPFGSRSRFEAAASSELAAMGVPESERPAIVRRLARERNVIGGSEIALIGLGAEFASERLGQRLIGQKVASSGGSIFFRQASLGKDIFRQTALPFVKAGAVEGVFAYSGSTALRTGKVARKEDVAVSGALGGATAGLLGPAIIKGQVVGKNTLRTVTNIIEPLESGGDFLSSQYTKFQARRGKTTFDLNLERNAPGGSRIDLQVNPAGRARVVSSSPASSFSSSSSPVSNVVQSPASSRSSSVTVRNPLAVVVGSRSTRSVVPSLSSSSQTVSRTVVPSPGSSVFVPLPSVTKVMAPVSTKTSTAVAVASRTTVSTNTKTTVTVPTPPFGFFPVIPPGGGLGGAGARGSGSGRAKKGYAPSVAAVAFGIKGTGRKGGGFTGLELRPITSRTQGRSFVNRIAG